MACFRGPVSAWISLEVPGAAKAWHPIPTSRLLVEVVRKRGPPVMGMPMKKFVRIVSRVMETLPKEFYPYIENLIVDVEDEPDEKTLKLAGFTDEEIEAGETLYGLFVPMETPPAWGGETFELGDLPRRLLIFKGPLEDDFPERKELLIEIRKTVIHELAHHFGFTERDLDSFEAKENPFKDNLDLDV